MEKIEITKQNVKEVLAKQNYELVYPIVFKEIKWNVGTKNDPKKEWGVFKYDILVEKENDYYTKSVEAFLESKEQIPQTKIKPYTEIYALFKFDPRTPEATGRFVKIIE